MTKTRARGKVITRGQKTPQEVVRELQAYGLTVESTPGHFKVRDPKSGAWLFDISSTPSDYNWYWGLRRHLRRIGLIKSDLHELDSRVTPRRGKSASSIDLDALAKAQAAAASAGERIPLLEDIEGQSEFFQTLPFGNRTIFSDGAVKEAIANMPIPDTSPKTKSSVRRFREFMEKNQERLEQMAKDRATSEGRRINFSGGSRSELVRIAIAEGQRRGLRVWTSPRSGEVSVANLLNGDQEGASIWVINLLEAAMDHLDGLRFDMPGEVTEIDGKTVAESSLVLSAAESGKLHGEAWDGSPGTTRHLLNEKPVETVEFPAEEPQAEIEVPAPPIAEVFAAGVEAGMVVKADSDMEMIRYRYASILLSRLENTSDIPYDEFQAILRRLDVLSGIETA